MAQTGLAHLCIAKGDYSTANTWPTYTEGKVVSKICEANTSYTYTEAKMYGDNGLVLYENSCTGGSVTISATHIPADDRVTFLGWDKNSDGEYIMRAKAAPQVGVGYVESGLDDNGDEYYQGVICLRTRFSEPSKNIKTKGENTEFNANQFQGNLQGCTIDNTQQLSYKVESPEYATLALAAAWVDQKLGIQAGG